MDLLFVWWGIAWLGQWFFSTHLHSPALTCLWLALLWGVLILCLKRNGQLNLYGLYYNKAGSFNHHRAIYLALYALPAVNLMLVIINGPSISGTSTLFFTLLLTVLGAVTEEFLFRGLLLRWLGTTLHLKTTAAVMLSALLFCVLHLLNGGTAGYLAFQLLCSFAFGICAGAITLTVKSLIPAMFLHILINITGEFVSSDASGLQTILYFGTAAIYLGIGIYFLKYSREGHC